MRGGHMSNNGDSVPPPPPMPDMSEPKLLLTIRVNMDNTISVSGPIEDRILSYGLLEEAKDCIRKYHANKTKPSIIPWKRNIP
jgi:hypothetical protein